MGSAVAPGEVQKRLSASIPALGELKGVLFDIDGTLTNSDPLHFLAFQEILVEEGFNAGAPIDEQFFRERISGRHNPQIALDLFPSWTIEQHQRFSEDKEQRFRTLAGKVLKPVDGLQEFLSFLEDKGLHKAAVTNAPRANTELMLDALGLDRTFEAVVLGEDCTRAKPFPDPYLRALQLTGMSPQHALVVEDSPTGVAAGAAAGVAVVGIRTSQADSVLLAAGASAVVSDYHELLALLKAL